MPETIFFPFDTACLRAFLWRVRRYGAGKAQLAFAKNEPITGNVGSLVKPFNRCGWQAEPESDASLPHQYLLMARQGVSGKGD